MTLRRRELLIAGASLPLLGLTRPAWAAPPMPAIRPRADWAGTLKPTAKLEPETDVRFLLVHHTETPNGDAADRTPERLRGIYAFHTGAKKGWPDVAYNFFVDRYGVIWEGRQGSLAGQVRGDATGGSQGFAELACFVGDHTTEPPTPAAMAAMTALLAWLAARDGLDLAGPVTFTSRGSNRWRKGVAVTTEQIAGHRDMSQTACPGDALYPLVASQLLPGARTLLAGGSLTTPTPTPTPTATPPAVATAEPTPDQHAATPGAAAGVPLDAIRWAGAGATVAGLAGVAAAGLLGRRRAAGQRELPTAGEPRAPGESPGPGEPGSAQQLEHDDDSADTEGGEQGDHEAP